MKEEKRKLAAETRAHGSMNGRAAGRRRPGRSPAILAGVATIALAATIPPALAGAWFVGLTAGQSDVQDYSLDGISARVDEKDLAWMVYGGYHFFRHFAAGAGYVDLGELEAEGSAFGGFTDTLSAKGYTVFGMGILPLGERVSLFGTAGAYRWDHEVRFRDSSETFEADESGTDPVLGAGVNFTIVKAAGLSLHAAWHRFKDVGNRRDSGHENDRDFLSAGVTFRFGR